MGSLEELVRNVVKGLHPYKPGKPIGEVQRELGLEHIVKMASNENPLGPSPKAVEAMRGEIGQVNYYPENSVFYLREALARKFELGEDYFIFGNGSSEVIHIVCHAFLDHGEEVSIIAEPSFIVYKLATLICGGVLKTVPLKEWTHDLESMLDAIDEHTKVLFICNPNNPTGTAVGKAEVCRMV